MIDQHYGCFTVLNTYNKMNCSDFSDDGGIIAIGLKDGSIIIWILDNKYPDDITQELIDTLQEFKDNDYEKISDCNDAECLPLSKPSPAASTPIKRVVSCLMYG